MRLMPPLPESGMLTDISELSSIFLLSVFFSEAAGNIESTEITVCRKVRSLSATSSSFVASSLSRIGSSLCISRKVAFFGKLLHLTSRKRLKTFVRHDEGSSVSKYGFPFRSKFIRNGILAMPAMFAKLFMLFSSNDKRSNEKRRSSPRVDDISFPVKISSVTFPICMKISSKLDNRLYDRFIDERRGKEDSPAKTVFVLNNSF
mmetsp:Transcript_18067/g.38947  ORF Transcript_18067/g.38947 Transcript_18067/m.38947 type:complete len:204 (-) Transcript_18067:20-631(-)